MHDIVMANELEPEASTQKIRVVRLEGNRKVARSIDFYNLDMNQPDGYARTRYHRPNKITHPPMA